MEQSNGSGTLRKPAIMVVEGSTVDPSDLFFFSILKAHSVLEMTIKSDFSAR